MTVITTDTMKRLKADLTRARADGRKITVVWTADLRAEPTEAAA